MHPAGTTRENVDKYFSIPTTNTGTPFFEKKSSGPWKSICDPATASTHDNVSLFSFKVIQKQITIIIIRYSVNI